MAGDDKPADGGNQGRPDAANSSDGGGRNRPRRNRRGNPRPTAVLRHTARFEGSCEGLKGHVYDVLDHNQADAFAKTTKELAGYVGRTLKEGDDVRLAVQNLALPAINKPTVPLAGSTDKYIEMEWQAEMKIYLGRMALLSSNMRTLFNIIIGQCSESMIYKLESTDEFETISANSDSIELLKAIKKVSFNYESQKFGPHALHEAMQVFYTCRQGERVTTESYLETFNNNVSIVTYCGGSLGTAKELGEALAIERKLVLATIDADTMKALRIEAQDRYLAVAFIMGADKKRFGALMTEMENDFLKYRTPNAYPQTTTQAYSWLLRYQKERGINNPRHVGSNEVAFANVGNNNDEEGVALVNRNIADITCHNCGKKGHYKSDCPEPQRSSANQLLTAGIVSGEFDSEPNFVFINDATNQRSDGIMMNNGGGDSLSRIPNTWILLDNQSTVDVFHNDKLLCNIRTTDGYMDIHCNAGVTSTNMVGDLKGYGTVWYHPKGIANILSLNRVKEKYQVTYDSHNGNALLCTGMMEPSELFNSRNVGCTTWTPPRRAHY